MTPHQLNTEWTEEQMALMLRKNKLHHERVKAEIDKIRGEQPVRSAGHSTEDRGEPFREIRDGERIPDSFFFAKIRRWQSKGGSSDVPLC